MTRLIDIECSATGGSDPGDRSPLLGAYLRADDATFGHLRCECFDVIAHERQVLAVVGISRAMHTAFLVGAAVALAGAILALVTRQRTGAAEATPPCDSRSGLPPTGQPAPDRNWYFCRGGGSALASIIFVLLWTQRRPRPGPAARGHAWLREGRRTRRSTTGWPLHAPRGKPRGRRAPTPDRLWMG